MKPTVVLNLLLGIPLFSMAQWDISYSPKIHYSNGNVGIGVANSNFKLSLYANEDQTTLGGNTQSVFRLMNGYDGAFGRRSEIQFGLGQNTAQALAVIAAEYSSWNGTVGGDLVFGTTPTSSDAMLERMRINSDGNVGIGTSPEAKLSLRTSTASQGLIISNCDNSGIQSHLGFTTADQPRLGLASESYLNTYNDGKWNFNSASSNGGSTLPMSFNTDGVSRFYIKADGNIGIGTNNPGARLEINHAGGQLKLSGGSVAGGVWTNSYDVLYLADWNTGNKGLNVNMTSGKVAIGTTDMPGSHLLYVNGSIVTTEVNVKLKTAWPDYVFENGYKLPSLSELEQFIKINKHLPDVPTAAEVKENGLSVGEMNAILLKKVEELTMYVIELKKENEEIKRIINK